jgi:DNA-binding FadR family transcriptional regulator
MVSSSRPSGSGYPRGGLHGQIVHAIGRQILSGKIRPGDLLPAQAGLPASRTVLREAIKVLAAKGLVESRQKTGTRVRPRHAWHLLDPDVMAWQQDGSPRVAFLQKLTEVRLIVEPAAAERAAQRARPTATWSTPWGVAPSITRPSIGPTSASIRRSCGPAGTTSWSA